MKKKHMLIMLVCCSIPLIGLGAIFFFNVKVSQALSIGLILLCPLSHILVMKFMMDDGGPNHNQHQAHLPEPEPGKIADRTP
jgi:hypothetical protein